jgi:hypothetical protein
LLSGGRLVDQHHVEVGQCSIGQRGRPHGVDDDSVDLAGAERLDMPLDRDLHGVAEEDREASGRDDPLGADHDVREERVPQVRDDHADREGPSPDQRARDDVRPIAELARGLQDPLAGGLRHAGRGVFGDDEGDERLRDARPAGHVAHGDAAGPGGPGG